MHSDKVCLIRLADRDMGQDFLYPQSLAKVLLQAQIIQIEICGYVGFFRFFLHCYSSIIVVCSRACRPRAIPRPNDN